jgi:hypothetical protein
MISATDDEMIKYGTNEDARNYTEGRHQDTRDALLWLAYGHLPPALAKYSAPFYGAACQLIKAISVDSLELTTALNGLVSAKDAAVRAGIRADNGTAGSVRRPQTVVDPPSFGRQG